jgi:uncharacterized membrane protein YphA (DoxX/SURF4 family)
MEEQIIGERVNGWLLAALRVLLGLLWLQNVGWKAPPDFAAVGTFVQSGIDNPTLPPYSWVLEHLVQPAIRPFGWLVLVVELALAVGLLFGLATRLAAAVGFAQSLAIGLTVARVPNEWGWSYWLMAGAHLAVFASPQAGRVASLDQTLRRALRGKPTGGLTSLYLRWAS